MQAAEPAVLSKLTAFLPFKDQVTVPLWAHYRWQQAAGWQLWRGPSLLGQAVQPEALFELFLQDALEQLIFPQKVHLIFHAGGLVKRGQGLLVCGQSGSGKSTLVAQLVAAGWAYLTDEAVAVSLERFEMAGFTRPIVLKSGSEFIWENGRDQPTVWPLPDGFTWLLPTFFSQGCWGETAVPQWVLFPRYQAGASFSVQPLSKAETAFQLMQQLVNARNLPDKGLPAVGRLGAQVSAYEVVYGQGTAVVDWLLPQVVRA